MSRKIVIGLCTVVAFFAGCIFVDNFPVYAPLIIFLVTCAGFACGYLFNKEMIKAAYEVYKNEITSLHYANDALKEELSIHKKEIESLKDAQQKVITEKASEKKSRKKTKTAVAE